MTVKTNAGYNLANRLAPSIGLPSGIFDMCSLLCRQARTHLRLQEELCSGPNDRFFDHATGEQIDKWQAQLETSIERCEKRINELVAELPEVNGQKITAILGGDPRGCTVKLKMPDGRTDDYGHTGICALE